MNKKQQHFQGDTTSIQQQTETQTPSQKRHSKAYYKLLHTYNTLTSSSRTQPISINSCQTPIIAERFFGCKLNQRQQLSEDIQRVLRENKQRRELVGKEGRKEEGESKEMVGYEVKVEEDDGFEIGDKDELDEVVEMGMKFVGGWMKGLLPNMSLNKNMTSRR